MFPTERRREDRYSIQQPAFVRVQGAAGEVESATENISTHFVLLRSEVLIPVGSKIDVNLSICVFVMPFPSKEKARFCDWKSNMEARHF